MSRYLNAPDSWLTSSGFPFLFQDTVGGGMPVVSQLSTALIPAVTVTLNGPGLMEGPTDGTPNTLTHNKKIRKWIKHTIIMASIQTLKMRIDPIWPLGGH